MNSELIDKIESQIMILTKLHYWTGGGEVSEDINIKTRHAIQLIRELTAIIFELEQEILNNKKPLERI